MVKGRRTICDVVRCILVVLCVCMTQFFSSCGKAPPDSNVIVLCSVRQENGNYEFPLTKILRNSSGLKITLKEGQDMSQYGLKYRGKSDAVFPNQVIAFYAAQQDSNTGKTSFQLVESAAVIDGKLPAKDNVSLDEFVSSLQGIGN